MKAIDVSVIISTYNNPKWLQKVLWSFDVQTFKDFEVVIADDGSNEDTKQLIERMKPQLTYPIQHIWHVDNGFQKTVILNKATMASKGDYLVYTDGDCIARADFLEVHAHKREAGYFLSGGYFKLPMTISEAITETDIKEQHCFDINWLKQHGLKSSFKNNKVTAKGLKERLFNSVTPTTATWNGHNASGYKKDIIAANGYDERMQYGGEDRELGERLFNTGLKAKQIRYSAICLHLDHERGYVKPEMIEKNKAIRATTKSEKITKTSFGIDKHISMIQLSEKDYLNEGLAQKCYFHPENKNLCIKLKKPDVDESHITKEVEYHKKISLKNIKAYDYPFYSFYHGTINTNLGKGYVYDLVRNETTKEVSKTLHHYIFTKDSVISDVVLDEALQQLKNQMIKHKVFASDLRPRNIYCKILKDGSVKMVIADGIGHRDFLPLADVFHFFAKRKIERRFQKIALQSISDHRQMLRQKYNEDV